MCQNALPIGVIRMLLPNDLKMFRDQRSSLCFIKLLGDNENIKIQHSVVDPLSGYLSVFFPRTFDTIHPSVGILFFFFPVISCASSSIARIIHPPSTIHHPLVAHSRQNKQHKEHPIEKIKKQ